MTIQDFIKLCVCTPAIPYGATGGSNGKATHIIPRYDMQDRLQEELRNCVVAQDGAASFIRSYEIEKVKKGLFNTYVVKGDEEAKMGIDIFVALFGLIGNGDGKYNQLTDPGWERAIGLVKGYLGVDSSLVDTEKLFQKKYEDRAKAAVALTKYGASIAIADDGEIVFSDFEKVFDELNTRIKNFGGKEFLTSLLKSIPYSSKFNRFITPKQGNNMSVEAPKPQIPYNYLLNLALRNLQSSGESKFRNKRNFDKILRLASTICFAILESQSYVIWEDIFHRDKSPLDYLRDLVYRESVFNLQQTSHVFMLRFLKFIIDREIKFWEGSKKKPKDYHKFEDIYKVLAEILRISRRDELVRLDLSRCRRGCLRHLSVNNILDIISISSEVINDGVLSPDDYDKVNYWNYPVVKMTDGSYWVLPSSIAARCCFEALINAIRQEDNVIDYRVGKDDMEQFVASLFDKANCSYLTGKYKVEVEEKEIVNGKEEVKVKEEDGESDGMVTSKDKIFLLEIKKKGLARDARQGKDENVLLDIASALLDSQVQLFRTSVALVKTDKEPKTPLALDDNGTIHEVSLGCRRMERISVALFPFGDMQDRMLMDRVLRTFVICRFDYIRPDDPMWDEEKKRRVDQIRKSFDKLKKKQKSLESYLNILKLDKLFFDSWFLDLEMLYHLLKGKKSVEEFGMELLSGKYTTYGTYDFYYERWIKERMEEEVKKNN